MKNKVNAAVIQMCSGPDVQSNLKQAEECLAGLDRPVDMILLPECFAMLGGDIPVLGNNTGPVRSWMSRMARQYKSWLMGGALPFVAEEGENSRAACFVYSPEGEEAARYDKIHLFDAEVSDGIGHYRESDDYSAGREPVVVDMGFAKVGLSICYDLRFPELYQTLRKAGADILIAPSAFTAATGKAHWEVLLRARAIENQCFVLAANQAGLHPNQRQTWGHSMIVSPWGDVLAEGDQETGAFITELDLSQVKSVRANMPCFQHKVLL